MNDYRDYLTGTDRLEQKWVGLFEAAFNTTDHDAIAAAANSSRTYVRDILSGKQPVRQPKARTVLVSAITKYAEKQ